VGASFGGSGLSLVLAGVAVAALGTALQQYLLLRHSDVIKEVYSWISGRVSTATWDDVKLVSPYVLLATVVLLLHRRQLDVLRVGDEEAMTLGSEVRRIRLVVVIAATLGTAAVVSVSGLIGSWCRTSCVWSPARRTEWCCRSAFSWVRRSSSSPTSPAG
jgi:iron complex transport system permease protein